jgi:hypothetical protein
MSATRRDDRLARLRDLLQKDPVANIRTRYLQDLHTEIDGAIHRYLVERRHHGRHARVADRVDHGRLFSPRQLGGADLLYVTDVASVAVLTMNK